MYVYCVYPAMLKISKQLSNCQITSNKQAPFLTIVQHESSIRKAISWSVTFNAI